MISGGLILHGFSSFIANEAGVGGLAIESFDKVGVDFEDFGMMLVNNSFHCPLGQYSFDADVNVSRVGATDTRVQSSTVRFIRVRGRTRLLVCALAAVVARCNTCRREKDRFAPERMYVVKVPLVLCLVDSNEKMASPAHLRRKKSAPESYFCSPFTSQGFYGGGLSQNPLLLFFLLRLGARHLIGL